MEYFRLTLTNSSRKELERLMQTAKNKGDLAMVRKIPHDLGVLVLSKVTNCGNIYMFVSSALRNRR